MIYRSNLTAPALEAAFRLSPDVCQTMGHDMPSDPDYEPKCGYLTHDEAAILYHVAKAAPGRWLDIGARFGWTAAHIVATGCAVTSVDPHFVLEDRKNRFIENVDASAEAMKMYWAAKVVPLTSEEYFRDKAGFHMNQKWFSGAMIDGDHDSPVPLDDAKACARLEIPVILFHDFQGQPIQDGVEYLMTQGYSTRIYWTPNGMALCWKADLVPSFVPPEHQPDPAIDWRDIRAMRCPKFDLSRCV